MLLVRGERSHSHTSSGRCIKTSNNLECYLSAEIYIASDICYVRYEFNGMQVLMTDVPCLGIPTYDFAAINPFLF